MVLVFLATLVLLVTVLGEERMAVALLLKASEKVPKGS
jgi:hypothetical protein